MKEKLKVESPECFGSFMVDVSANSNDCNVCSIRAECYMTWKEKDERKQKILAEKEKPWFQQRPLIELFPELRNCPSCNIKNKKEQT